MTVESVCSLVISEDDTEVPTETGLPEEGVRLIPAIGSVKLSTEVPVGGVSYREIVRLAVPPPQFETQGCVPKPLQEFKIATAQMASRPKNNFDFMRTPLLKLETRLDWAKGW